MMRTFRAHHEILPPVQKRLWPALCRAPEMGLVLYGGTAIALRLGHRVSVAFDFFTDRSLNRETLSTTFPFILVVFRIRRQK